jgi:choline dehydrogenase-like flavoprotein
MLAVSLCPNPTVFQKTLALNDFYFATKEWDFPMGHISFVGKTDANVLAAGAPRFVPGFTLDLMARHSLDFWLTSEDLPDPANRVSLRKDGGITLAHRANNEEGHTRLQAKLKSLLKQVPCATHGAGCIQDLVPMSAYIGKRIPLAGVAHQNGTLRFGADPKTSVLDVDCKTHELDNLYVVDASFFPSSSAVNPALTIMANALRVGDRLLERLQ